MNKSFFIKRYFLPAAMFSLAINALQLAPMLYMFQLQDKVIPTKSEPTLWVLTLLVAGALIVMGVLDMVRSRVMVRANNAIELMFAPYMFKKMTEDASTIDGSQYSYALGDLQLVRGFLTGPATVTWFEAPFLPVYMFIMYFMNPVLFYVLTAGFTMMGLLTFATEQLTKKPQAEASSFGRLANNFVSLTMKNAEVVNAMGMADNIIKRWTSLNIRMLRSQTTAGNRSGAINGVTRFVRMMMMTLTFGSGTYIILTGGAFTPGLMIVGGIMYGRAMGPLEGIISGWKGLLEARAAYSRLTAFMESPETSKPISMDLPPPTGQITLDHVTFGIRALNKVIVRDVSFSLSAGDQLGVIGPSASGKSTLARLLVGVWRPLQGDIRLDAADIANWPSERLGGYIGYLPQDIELFSGTVAENIARLAEPVPDKVIAAAKLAGLHEVILHLPNGYDTQVGDGGAFLSGGQRQRIGLARALYGNPKLVVLDEPNSSLDTDGEKALMQALDYLKQAGTTTIMITHNANYLNKVDKLLVLQYGSVAAFGPKEWVLARLNKSRQHAFSEPAAQDAVDNIKVTQLPTG
jgi:PrtD family type I secretion system ABC transporter